MSPFSARRSRVNSNIIPDFDDPNNYCKSCKQSYANEANYKRYLEKLHNLVREPEPRTFFNEKILLKQASYSNNMHA
jgi:hypothetical protein